MVDLSHLKLPGSYPIFTFSTQAAASSPPASEDTAETGPSKISNPVATSIAVDPPVQTAKSIDTPLASSQPDSPRPLSHLGDAKRSSLSSSSLSSTADMLHNAGKEMPSSPVATASIFGLPVKSPQTRSDTSRTTTKYRDTILTTLFKRPEPSVMYSPHASIRSCISSRSNVLAPVPTSNLFTFSRGNVKLLATYQSQPMIGSVSTDALVLASPVWKKFLFPPWAKEEDASIQPEEKQIDCSEDDGEALLVLLNIVHLNFKAVPKTVGYDLQFRIAILVDQYDCVKVVQPWLDIWMEEELGSPLRTQRSTSHWLFIAWVYGRKETFQIAAKGMVKVCTTTASGQLLRSGKEITFPMPPKIIESIHACRHDALDALLDIPYTRLAMLEKAASTGKPVCKVYSSKDRRRECDSATYGSIVLGLIAHDLYPRKDVHRITASVSSIADVLRSLQVHLEHDDDEEDEAISLRCHLNVKRRVTFALRKLKDPTLSSHLEHMRIQRGEDEINDDLEV